MRWATLSSTLLSFLVLGVSAVPQVQLGRTTVVGVNASSNVEFFGGIDLYNVSSGQRSH